VEFDLQNLSIIEQHDLFTKSFTRDKRPATNWSASLASTSGREFAQSGNYSQEIRLIGTAHNPEDGKNLNRQSAADAPICRNSLADPKTNDGPDTQTLAPVVVCLLLACTATRLQSMENHSTVCKLPTPHFGRNPKARLKKKYPYPLPFDRMSPNIRCGLATPAFEYLKSSANFTQRSRFQAAL
jgi:hypothetical protein